MSAAARGRRGHLRVASAWVPAAGAYKAAAARVRRARYRYRLHLRAPGSLQVPQRAASRTVSLEEGLLAVKSRGPVRRRTAAAACCIAAPTVTRSGTRQHRRALFQALRRLWRYGPSHSAASVVCDHPWVLGRARAAARVAQALLRLRACSKS